MKLTNPILLSLLLSVACLPTACRTSQVPPPSPAAMPTKTQYVELLRQGKHLLEHGKIAEARTALERCLQIDPKSKAAKYYMSLVEEKEYALNSRGKYTHDMYPTLPPRPAR